MNVKRKRKTSDGGGWLSCAMVVAALVFVLIVLISRRAFDPTQLTLCSWPGGEMIVQSQQDREWLYDELRGRVPYSLVICARWKDEQ